MNDAKARIHQFLLGGFIALGAACHLQSATSAFIGQNFTASTLFVDSSALPPDSNGAAGPLHFVELINGRFSVFNKTNAARVQTLTDLEFWAQAGITIPSHWSVSDPRIIFDPGSRRWFAAAIDFDPLNNINTNRFLLAISVTADPGGAWKSVAIPCDPGGNNFGSC